MEFGGVMKKYIARLAVLLAVIMPVAAKAGDIVVYELSKPHYYKDGDKQDEVPDFVTGTFGNIIVSKGGFLPSTYSYGIDRNKMPEGYYTAKWSLNGSKTILTSNNVDNINITFDDKWESTYGTILTLIVSINQKQYDYTYSLGEGGSWVQKPSDGKDVKYWTTNTAASSNCVKRDGHAFKGWLCSTGKTVAGDEEFTGSTLGIQANGDKVTLTAQWSEETYTATIAAGKGGTGESSVDYAYSTSQQTKPITLPTRTGHTISGWTASGYSGSRPEIDDDLLKIPAKTTGNFTMTPTWKANTITVIYYGNGATAGSTKDSTFTYDVSGPLRENGYEKSYTVTYHANGGSVDPAYDIANYTFRHWNNQKDGKGAYTYEDRAIVTNPCGVASGYALLYAQWTDKVFVTLPTPTHSSSAFQGWYTAQTGGDLVGMGGDTYAPQADIDLYAHWGTKYTITTVAQPTSGGTVSGGGSYDAGASATLTATANTGYSFTQWDDGVKAASREITVTKDATYTANFEANKYMVVYELAGGICTETYRYVTYDSTYGAEKPLPIPTRENYYFDGWYDGETLITNDTPVKITSTQILTAHWSKIPPAPTYFVAFNGNGATNETPMAVQKIERDKATALTPNVYAKPGSTFAGWATNGMDVVAYTNCATVLNLAEADQTNTLKAVWKVNTYTLAFASGAKTVLNPEAHPDRPGQESGAGVELPKCQYINLPSCGFDGWVDENSVTNQAGTTVTNYVSQSGETLTYKAAWKDSGPLSPYVGLAGIAALTNLNEQAYYRWKGLETGGAQGGPCIRYEVSFGDYDCSMAMLVNGPGTLKFRYKSDVGDDDSFELYIDGKYMGGFAEKSYDEVEEKISTGGIHAIKWRCYREGSGSSGYNYIDNVTWTPKGGKPKPLILFIK